MPQPWGPWIGTLAMNHPLGCRDWLPQLPFFFDWHPLLLASIAFLDCLPRRRLLASTFNHATGSVPIRLRQETAGSPSSSRGQGKCLATMGQLGLPPSNFIPAEPLTFDLRYILSRQQRNRSFQGPLPPQTHD